MCRKIVLLLGMLACTLLVPAQESYKFRVQLTDKNPTVYSLDRPEEFLSERLCKDVKDKDWVSILPTCRSARNTLPAWYSWEENW